ncbi:glycoside hydrolase family 99-like domain-containing protein [Paenibacillus sp. IITD108]|uniref:glycoside hydrolase family 99-like domain-containing protein n=1 Tax=Paenibacillus sp. IITD108 TaxID=3116649 RepID=UPI002F407DAA
MWANHNVMNTWDIRNAHLTDNMIWDAHPGQQSLIVINSWNEWTETSYLQPDDRYGYSYLEAIKSVFK